MKRFIFFPLGEKKSPKIIYVNAQMGNELRGSTIEQEVLDGRMAFYPVHRCQPYSDVLWEMCIQWVERRNELEKEYVDLTKKGLKANPSDISSVQP